MTATEPAALRYAPLPTGRPAAELEEGLVRRWAEEGLAAAVDRARADAPAWVFFEGPPTANGRPGIHHVFSRAVKDLFCRYRVMKGYHVTRKAGWDTHGLPVEIEVERQLGISSKQEIEAIGVEAFNRQSRESVWRYKDDWEKLSRRIGYELDYEHPYITYANDYIESVWWALRTLHARDRLYRGHKILPYCPRCGTALSSHELALGYETVTDPSVFVALDLLTEESPAAGASGRRRILVWTTTPWTLVSNTALAVNAELPYIEVRRRPDAAGDGDGTLILAEARAQALLGDAFTDRWTIERRYAGSKLVGMRYRRPLDWVPYPDGAHELILAAGFVAADEGTGIVHLAPAFGADDYAAGQRHGLAFLQPVNARGEFPADVPVVGGRFVKAADPLIIEELERRGVLWRAGTIAHSYPHCWRCGTPLLNYARESWFVRTTAFRESMLARNARVEWHPPEVGSGRFGEWLSNNVDWALSRDRYWGTPLPLWVCDADRTHVEAIGSYAELAERSGAPLPPDFDPHKPFIDSYEWPCRGRDDNGRACGGVMRRVPEVIDTWFDSGSMPFAQWHFPFENAEAFRRHYPADFVAEGVDQTRGWFYSLLAIAAGLDDALPNNTPAGADDAVAAPYRAVVVNDLLLDAEGQKMSKSRGNVVDPWSVVRAHGADAVRLFLVSSSQLWVPRRFDEDAIRELAGGFLLTFKHTYDGIFATYANFGWAPSELDPPPARRPAVDRWILSRAASVGRQADALLEKFEATSAARVIMEFIVDDVSKWYVRLNRKRFYDVESEDNRAAFATLHEVLVAACRLLAPFCPFVTDWMHRELIGTTVHLAPYDATSAEAVDGALERSMAAIRRLATLGRAAREEAKVRVRQPLSRLVCVVPDFAATSTADLVPLLAAELNVKEVQFAESGDALVQLTAKPNFRALGKRFGKRTPLAAQAVAALAPEALAGFERGEPVSISVDGESHELHAEELSLVRRAAGDLVIKEEAGFIAAIEPTVTVALRQEGLARELVSRVQRMRKEAGFAVSDRIVLAVAGDAEVQRAVQAHRGYIATETLAIEITVGESLPPSPDAVQAVDLDGLAARIAIMRVS